MFTLSKKKKLQEIEIVEKNENISEEVEKSEKNESISEEIEKAQQHENLSKKIDSMFPSAKELLETTHEKWKYVTAEEILEKIKYESSKGIRYAKFYKSYISDELVNELRAQGYKVEVVASPVFVGPYFEISW